MRAGKHEVLVYEIQCPMGAVFWCRSQEHLDAFLIRYREQFREELAALGMGHLRETVGPQITVHERVMRIDEYDNLPTGPLAVKLFGQDKEGKGA